MRILFFVLVSSVFISLTESKCNKKPNDVTVPPVDNSVYDCESGWTRIYRKSGLVCLKTFRTNSSRDAAESDCQKNGGATSGIENEAERQWILQQYLPVQPADVESCYIWIGLKYKEECAKNNQDPSCIPKDKKSFKWTDPTVTGTDGMIWWGENPSSAGYGDVCGTMAIQVKALSAYGVVPGRLDDDKCVAHFCNLGYVCAKKPTKM